MSEEREQPHTEAPLPELESAEVKYHEMIREVVLPILIENGCTVRENEDGEFEINGPDGFPLE